MWWQELEASCVYLSGLYIHQREGEGVRKGERGSKKEGEGLELEPGLD